MSSEYENQYNQQIEEFKTISRTEKKEKEQIISVIEKKYETTKKQIINLAAELLEKLGYEHEKISIQIKKDLEGYTNKDYISHSLEEKFKNKNMARTPPEKILVAAGSNEQSTEVPVIDNKTKNQLAREEYEKNKYYKDVPKGNTFNKGSSLQQANEELETTVTSDKEQTEYIASLKQQVEQATHELKKIQNERIQHTTVNLPKLKFQDIYDLIIDKKVKRVFLDFDDNMTVTKARAEL